MDDIEKERINRENRECLAWLAHIRGMKSNAKKKYRDNNREQEQCSAGWFWHLVGSAWHGKD